MSLLLFVVFGFAVGLLARAIMPGRQPMGFFATALLGMAGSLVGGAIGNLLAGQSLSRAEPAGWIGSIVGALLVLAAVLWAGGGRRLRT